MSRYVTTTLPYVNDDPHIGFAVEILQADVLARAWRLAGEEVFFNTGTDEHGQKVYEAAQKAGQTPQVYADHYAAEFRKLKDALNLDNPTFVRTSSAEHVAAAQEMWQRCKKDIYKKEYEGLYCVGCESFKTARELDESGHCLIHPTLELQKLKEENYFFAFSKYQDKLLSYLSGEVAVPGWRKDEALNFVKGGLEDFSISREKSRLPWGIAVPGDDAQVMYVWFDALTNYISTLGWPADQGGNFKKFWVEGKTLQVAGKDQVRFQSLMWQAMLMSAEIKNTDQVFYHGFINSAGQKMSKSIGNVINPNELVKKYGTDATRYMLLRHVHPVEDTDVTWERLDEWYTANLVNGLGNLVARVMKLAETHLDQPANIEPPVCLADVFRMIDTFEFNRAADIIWTHIQRLDGEITDQKPFELIKINKERGKDLISQLASEVGSIGYMLQPFMPNTSAEIIEAVKQNKKPENLFPRL